MSMISQKIYLERAQTHVSCLGDRRIAFLRSRRAAVWENQKEERNLEGAIF